MKFKINNQVPQKCILKIILNLVNDCCYKICCEIQLRYNINVVMKMKNKIVKHLKKTYYTFYNLLLIYILITFIFLSKTHLGFHLAVV